jgi:hypothetical protein
MAISANPPKHFPKPELATMNMGSTRCYASLFDAKSAGSRL